MRSDFSLKNSGCGKERRILIDWYIVMQRQHPMFVVLGLRCLLDCHVLKGFGIYMIGILDRLY